MFRCAHHIRCSVSQRNQFPCSFFFCICKIWGHRKLLLKAKAHNRLVLTCWEEAGTSAPVLGFILLCWEVWEKSPKGLIKETYLQEQRRGQTACTHIITQRWQSAGRHRSADHLVHLTGSIQREASQRVRWLETLHRESAAADGGVINETILIGLWSSC